MSVTAARPLSLAAEVAGAMGEVVEVDMAVVAVVVVVVMVAEAGTAIGEIIARNIWGMMCWSL